MIHNSTMKKTNTSAQDAATTKLVRENSVGWMLNRLSTDVNVRMKEALKPLGLTQSQFAILMLILESEGLSQSAIGKKITLTASAMTRNLDALEERGLIERQTDEASRRSFKIVMTPEGRALAPQAFATVKAVNQWLLDGLDDESVIQLKSSLTQLIDQMNAK